MVSPIGAVIGVFVMLLAGTLLSFMDVPSDWQLSVQGALLILSLARACSSGDNMASGITLRTALRQRWLWSFVGAAAMWLVIAVAANGHGTGETLSVALAFATFYVIVGIGEMLVITTGPGNIDLSIPSVMTLAGYLSIGAMGADDKRILIGFAVALGAGLIAGVVNVALIRLARIPPMIATLATGFIMQSMAIAYSSGSTTKPAPLLVMLSSTRLLGVPVLALIFIGVAAVVAFVLARTALGRSISAIGQNRRAAYLAGLSVELTSISVYLVSSTLAGLGGPAARLLFGRRFIGHVVRLLADDDRRRRYRGNEHCRRPSVRRRHLGRVPVSLSRGRHAQHPRRQRRAALRRDRRNHHHGSRPIRGGERA